MIKKVFITNGGATSGKDSFAEALSKHVVTFKYSSIDLVKDMLEFAGIPKEPKTEEKRLLYSDTKDRLTKYDDIPFKDITSVVVDFKDDRIDTDVLLIDIREPEEIKRAVETFGAETILIRNPRAEKITSNHADRDVENYNYDYIIENDGSLDELNAVAKEFAEYVVRENGGLPPSACYVFDGNKSTLMFQCNRMLR